MDFDKLKKDFENYDFLNKNVVIRFDYNVPFDENGEIADDTRIKASYETLNYVMSKGAKRIVLLAHRGNPKGEDSQLSLKNVYNYLKINYDLKFYNLEDFEKESPEEGLFLLENVRFFEKEKKCDENFSKRLASLGEVYINDAFSVMHRKHASTYGIIDYISKALIGKEALKEFDALNFSNAKKPFVVIMGGAKLSTKLPVVKKMLNIADYVLLGSGLSLTIFAANGYNIGSSLNEKNLYDEAKDLMKKENLILPTDFKVTTDIHEDFDAKNVNNDKITKGEIAIDIGYKTIEKFKRYLKKAKTIFWNGPMGLYEIDAFNEGTKKIANYIINELNDVSFMTGGGDIVAALKKSNVDINELNFVSIGGGATLKLITEDTLPVIDKIMS